MKWIGALALTTLAFAAQDATPLRRQLKVGTTEVYKAESSMKQNIEIPSMGEQDIINITSGTITVKTGAVDATKGTAEVELTTKIEKSTTDGSLAAMMGQQETKLPEPKTEKGTLDSRNRLVIKADPKAAAGGDHAQMMGMVNFANMGAAGFMNLIELPEKPIKAGDTLEVNLPGAAGAATMGAKDLKMTIKFIEERDTDTGKAWAVSFLGDMKLDVDTSKLPKQANQPDNPMGNMKITGTVHITGEGLVDKLTGKTISNRLNLKNDIKVFLEAMNAEIPAKGDITLKLDLVK